VTSPNCKEGRERENEGKERPQTRDNASIKVVLNIIPQNSKEEKA
jgi:hypothetical protein